MTNFWGRYKAAAIAGIVFFVIVGIVAPGIRYWPVIVSLAGVAVPFKSAGQVVLYELGVAVVRVEEV